MALLGYTGSQSSLNWRVKILKLKLLSSIQQILGALLSKMIFLAF